MTQLILIRHGETHWNTEHRMQGQRDSPLTGRGLWQAQRLAERLQSVSFTALYSSDLPRAYLTAQCIAATTGHTVVTDRRLRERHFGVFEGLTGADMERRDPAAYAQFIARDPDYAVPGGESPTAFTARARTTLEEIAARHNGGTVTIVTHGLVLDCAHRAARGLALEVRREVPLVNGSLNWFVCRRGQWSAGRWGDTDHLGEAGGTVFDDGTV